MADRKTKNPKPDRSEYRAAYEAANKDKIRARNARYRADNIDKVRKASRDWAKKDYKEHPEKYVGMRSKSSRLYFERHREEIRKRRKEAYWKNRTENIKKARAYTENHKEEVSAKQRIHYQKNKESINKKQLILTRNRRARIRNNGGRHSQEDIDRLFEVQRGKCAACKKAISHERGKAKYHVDHVHPLILGGSNGPENLQLLCSTCNRKKHAKTPEQWAQENGLLFI